MTEQEAYERLFRIDLNAPNVRRIWKRIIADMLEGGIVHAVRNLEREINSQK